MQQVLLSLWTFLYHPFLNIFSCTAPGVVTWLERRQWWVKFQWTPLVSDICWRIVLETGQGDFPTDHHQVQIFSQDIKFSLLVSRYTTGMPKHLHKVPDRQPCMNLIYSITFLFLNSCLGVPEVILGGQIALVNTKHHRMTWYLVCTSSYTHSKWSEIFV